MKCFYLTARGFTNGNMDKITYFEYCLILYHKKIYVIQLKRIAHIVLTLLKVQIKKKSNINFAFNAHAMVGLKKIVKKSALCLYNFFLNFY